MQCLMRMSDWCLLLHTLLTVDAGMLQVGSILNTCERYALDAKRLHVQPESDETAAAFESLSSKASQLLTYY